MKDIGITWQKCILKKGVKMASFNSVTLVGNLTRDPETRFLPSGMSITEFGLAINESYKNKSGELVENTVFVDVSAWGKQGESVGKYLSKGSQCLVDGKLKFETWEKDGSKRSKLSVTGDRVVFLGGKQYEGENRAQTGNTSGSVASTGSGDEFGGEDIPF